jgi:uncharacterized membrane-anchored protein
MISFAQAFRTSMAAVLFLFSGCQSSRQTPADDAKSPPARLASIAMSAADGTVIVLADRSTWIIDPEHRSVAQKWRSADLVEAISRSQSIGIDYPDILTNQESGSSLRAKQSKDFEG